MSDLVGKKKLIINDELWGAPFQNDSNIPIFDGGSYNVSVSNSPVGMTFFSYDNKGYVNKDNLRIALGKNWNTAPENEADQKSAVVTKNDWGPLKIFYNQPLGIKYCFEGQDKDYEYPGFFSDMDGPVAMSFKDEGIISDLVYYNAIWKEKIVVSASVPKGPMAELDDETANNPELNKSKRPNLNLWAGFIKCGIQSEGKLYKPIIRNQGNGPSFPSLPGNLYYDHYHESVNPFTPKELMSKNPFGKAAFANVSTYYKSTYLMKSLLQCWQTLVILTLQSCKETWLATIL